MKLNKPQNYKKAWNVSAIFMTTWGRFSISVGKSIVEMRRSQDRLVSYTRACETSAGYLRSIYPNLGMRQLFGDVTNGPVTSQLTDPTKWPNQPLELIEIFEHINTHNKESLTQRCRRSANVQLCLVFLYISISVTLHRK